MVALVAQLEFQGFLPLGVAAHVFRNTMLTDEVWEYMAPIMEKQLPSWGAVGLPVDQPAPARVPVADCM